MAAPLAIEVNTFSAVVDTVVSRSGRLDKRLDILSYARTTMRECQVVNRSKFQKDVEETQITAVNADPFTWVTPAQFRHMMAVSYPNMIDGQGKPIYPKFKIIGKSITDHDTYYYQSGDSWIFAGQNGTASATTLINVAYLKYFDLIQYAQDVLFRPARYMINVDGTEGWTYQTVGGVDYNSTTTLQETARNLVTNWILLDWFDLILEGALAKLYKTNEDPRASSTYALYKQQQNDLLNAEALASEIQQ